VTQSTQGKIQYQVPIKFIFDRFTLQLGYPKVAAELPRMEFNNNLPTIKSTQCITKTIQCTNQKHKKKNKKIHNSTLGMKTKYLLLLASVEILNTGQEISLPLAQCDCLVKSHRFHWKS